MKLAEFLEEALILAAPMNEMANLFPKRTGLSTIIWFGEVGGQHGPRIKVSNTKGKFDLNSNFVVSVEKIPRILTPKSVNMKSEELEDVLDWIKLNYDDLMEMWKMYESGNGDPTETILNLKKI